MSRYLPQEAEVSGRGIPAHWSFLKIMHAPELPACKEDSHPAPPSTAEPETTQSVHQYPRTTASWQQTGGLCWSCAGLCTRLGSVHVLCSCLCHPISESQRSSSSKPLPKFPPAHPNQGFTTSTRPCSDPTEFQRSATQCLATSPLLGDRGKAALSQVSFPKRSALTPYCSRWPRDCP